MYYIESTYDIMKARTIKRSTKPPPDAFIINEATFDHYWKLFKPPGDDEEFSLIKQI